MSKNHIFLICVSFIDALGLGIIIPVLPDLMRELLGQQLSWGEVSLYGGYLILSYALASLIASPILGSLSDYFGRKPILIFAMFGLAVDYLIMATTQLFWVLFIGRIVAGALGASYSTVNAAIADLNEKSNRSKMFAFVGAAWGVGFILGPALGGIIGEYGTRLPFFLGAIVAGVNFCGGLFLFKETIDKRNRQKINWKRANFAFALKDLASFPNVRLLFVALFFAQLAHDAYPVMWNFFLKNQLEWSPFMLGISLATFGVFSAIVMAVITPYCVKRFGDNIAAQIGYILGALGFMLFSTVNAGWMVFALAPIIAMFAISGPASKGLISSKIPNNMQGKLQGVLTSLISISTIITPIVFTNVFFFATTSKEFYFPGAPFLFAGIFLIISFIFLRMNSKKHPEKIQTSAVKKS